MEVLFSDSFKKSVKKHAAIKKQIRKKVDMLIENPISLGEPLKGNLVISGDITVVRFGRIS